MIFLVILFFIFWILVYQLFLIVECRISVSAMTLSCIVSLLIVKIIFVHISSHKKEKDIIHVGISPDYFPFTFINQNGVASGFDIDLFQEIAKRMHKKVNFVCMQFEALMPSLQLQTIDALIGGLGITEERILSFLPSVEYYTNSLCILSLPTHKIHSISDLQNMPCIAISGYNSYDFIHDNNITKNILCVKSFADGLLYLDLQKGLYFFTNKTMLTELDTLNKHYNIFYIDNYGEKIGIFFHKKNISIKHTIDKILNEIKNDHTIEELKKKWKL